jgi:cell division septal protein FtsQ
MRTRSSWKRYARQTSSRSPHPRRRRAVLVIVIVIVAVSILWGWRIQTVEVRGATIIPNAAVRDAILAELQQRRFGVFPRSSMLLVGLNDLERSIRERFAFQAVEAKRHRNGTVVFTVTEQPLAALATFPNGAKLTVGVTGQALGVAPEALNNATSLMALQWNGDPPSIGASLVAEPAITALRSVWEELALAGGPLQPTLILQLSGSTDAFNLRTTSGATVSVSTSEHAGDQLRKLRALLRDYPSPVARAKLRSIDLRYGDRVYIQ